MPPIIESWPYDPKSKDQIWKVKVMMDTGHVVNFDNEYCLGYSRLVGRIFGKNSCNGRDDNGKLLKTLDWSFVAIRDENGGKKCVTAVI